MSTELPFSGRLRAIHATGTWRGPLTSLVQRRVISYKYNKSAPVEYHKGRLIDSTVVVNRSKIPYNNAQASEILLL